MEAVASSCLGTQVAREGGHRLGKHLSQGKGPGTGDLAIAALGPTQVVSQAAQNSGRKLQAFAGTGFFSE